MGFLKRIFHKTIGVFKKYAHGLIIGFCFILLITAGTAVIKYVSVFGMEYSKDQATWGIFGDYVGGFVGAIISLVAVLLIYNTYSLQKRELNETQELIKDQNNDQLYFRYISLIQDQLKNVYYQKDLEFVAKDFLKGRKAVVQLFYNYKEEIKNIESVDSDDEMFQILKDIKKKVIARSNYLSIVTLFVDTVNLIKSKSFEDKEHHFNTLNNIFSEEDKFLITILLMTHDRSENIREYMFQSFFYFNDLHQIYLSDYLPKRITNYLESLDHLK